MELEVGKYYAPYGSTAYKLVENKSGRLLFTTKDSFYVQTGNTSHFSDKSRVFEISNIQDTSEVELPEDHPEKKDRNWTLVENGNIPESVEYARDSFGNIVAYRKLRTWSELSRDEKLDLFTHYLDGGTLKFYREDGKYSRWVPNNGLSFRDQIAYRKA